jgi:hypothetical protein
MILSEPTPSLDLRIIAQPSPAQPSPPLLVLHSENEKTQRRSVLMCVCKDLPLPPSLPYPSLP